MEALFGDGGGLFKLYHIGGGNNTPSGDGKFFIPCLFFSDDSSPMPQQFKLCLVDIFLQYRIVDVGKATCTIHPRGLFFRMNYCIISLLLLYKIWGW